MPASRFEKIQCATRIDVEIVKRPGSGQVVARLSCRVDNERRPNVSEQGLYVQTIADIEFMMFEILVLSLQSTLIPSRVDTSAEEVRAHVVVDTMKLPTVFIEIIDNFRD